MGLEDYLSEKIEYGRPPLSTPPQPWLVICHGKKMKRQTFFSISENRYYVKTIPELRNKNILADAHEWLVLLDRDSKDCYIWNPISSYKIQLPPLPDSKDNLKCLLSAPPYDPECCMLFLEDKKPQTLHFCKPGHDREFHKQDLQLIEDDTLSRWTVFKGKIYGLTLLRSILVLLDVDHDSRKVTVTPMLNQPAYDREEFLDMPWFGSYLIQSDNDDKLLYVHKLYFGMQLKEVYGFLVFQFDFVKKSWVKVTSIGETAIFLCDIWGTTYSTKGTNLQRGSIYFKESDDRRLYVYNLETQSLSLFVPCPHVSKKNSRIHWLKLPPQCN